MKLSQFKFKLPEELIAQEPASQRDESRLMVVNRKTGEIEHKIFKDVISYFNEGDVFVFTQDHGDGGLGDAGVLRDISGRDFVSFSHLSIPLNIS